MLDRSIIGYIYWNLIILGINGLCCFHHSYQLQILISFIKCPTYFSPVHFLHNLNNNSLLYTHLEFPFKCLIALIVKIPIIWILFIVFKHNIKFGFFLVLSWRRYFDRVLISWPLLGILNISPSSESLP